MGVRYYRFSISWSRLLPSGHGTVNEEGVEFYSRLIDALLASGIHPVVTLYHWDLPLALQLEHDGWLTEATASAFVQYATLCFERYGDRVKHWITFNEPLHAAVNGHARGEHAPGRSIRPTREPYVAVHYMLLAHAYAVHRYRSQFSSQGGLVSIALNSDWREPATDAPADVAAALRSMEFNLGWLADPLYLGDYPASMRRTLGKRLPSFTAAQRGLLLNSTDYFALQHYSTMAVSARPAGELPADSFYSDEGVRYHSTPGASKNVLGWDVAPFGIYKLLRWVHARYSPRGGIVLTENGYPRREDSVDVARNDASRVCYLKLYLSHLHRALSDGVDVRGYFVWTLLDNFEWAYGTAPRFGLFHVDFASGKRTAKSSAAFFSRLAQQHAFSLAPGECNTSVPVHERFSSEGRQLHALLNATDGPSGAPAATRVRDIARRAARLAAIAEMQARYNAERGEMRLMRAWVGKAAKMRTFAEQRRRALRQSQAQGQQQSQAQAQAQSQAEQALQQGRMEDIEPQVDAAEAVLAGLAQQGAGADGAGSDVDVDEAGLQTAVVDGWIDGMGDTEAV